MTKIFQSIVLTGATMTALTTMTSAQSIFIDFGKTGQETSGNWNNFAEPDSFRFGAPPNIMLTDMIDSSGADTGVDLVYFSESNESNVASGVGGADNNVATSTGYATSATRDTLFLNRGDNNSISVTFELRDLQANGFYDLSFFASVPTNDRSNTTWTVGSDSVSLNPGNYTGDTVTLSSVQADASGTLQIIWSNNPDGGSVNDSAHWSTLEIVSVPEPAAFALLAGAAGLLLATSRRSARR